MARLAPSERIRDADRTRAELLAVATEVFATHGYSGARVDEIAERTSTTKRMIYYYFGGKEQLYLAVLEAAYRNIREAEQSINAGDLPPADAVRRIAELTFDHHHAHPEFIRLVSVENIHQAEHLQQVEHLRDLGAPAASLLEDVLARGREAGAFRTDVDAIDVHMLISAYCVFQVANSATFGFLFGRDMLADDVRRRHRAILGDAVVAWLTAR
ncbi:TetR/AcrR family transcriptional regulator [Nocardioides sp. DS6]|uniref:TetR/AcrR family transcriptional regulator n=1 Tax=Nocardioides eburneus TaxID=3231482 RepID=A0ABV3SZ23_9ACTN